MTVLIETADVSATSLDISNTSTGGRNWRMQSVGSSVSGRVGNFEIVLVGGQVVAKFLPSGRMELDGATGADPIQLHVDSTSMMLGGTGVLGKSLFGVPTTATQNRPDTLFNMVTRSYVMDLNDVAVTGIVSQSAFLDQVIVRNGLGTGTTGDRHVSVNWSDFMIDEDGGANLDAFLGGNQNVFSFSSDFTGILVGHEFDTFVDVSSAVTNPYVVGVVAYAGVNDGPGTVSNYVAGLQGVGCYNGTSSVGHLMGVRADAQFSHTTAGGTAGNLSLFYAGDTNIGPSTGTQVKGTVSGDYSSYRASRGTYSKANVSGGFYAFYAEAISSAGVATEFNSRFGGGTWDTGHVMLGGYHLWVEAATGKLRIKSSAPTSDADGTVVGTQT